MVSTLLQLWSGSDPRRLLPIGGTFRSSDARFAVTTSAVHARSVTDDPFVAVGRVADRRPEIWLRFSGQELFPAR